MFKKMATIMFFLGLLVMAIVGWKQGSSTALTGLAVHNLLLVNLIGLYFIYKAVAQKKSIALVVVVIILKYPLLGYIVVKMTRQSWFETFGLVVGFITFLSSIVIVTLLKHFRKL